MLSTWWSYLSGYYREIDIAHSQWDSPLQLMKSDASCLGDLSVRMFPLQLTETDLGYLNQKENLWRRLSGPPRLMGSWRSRLRQSAGMEASCQLEDNSRLLARTVCMMCCPCCDSHCHLHNFEPCTLSVGDPQSRKQDSVDQPKEIRGLFLLPKCGHWILPATHTSFNGGFTQRTSA